MLVAHFSSSFFNKHLYKISDFLQIFSRTHTNRFVYFLKNKNLVQMHLKLAVLFQRSPINHQLINSIEIGILAAEYINCVINDSISRELCECTLCGRFFFSIDTPSDNKTTQHSNRNDRMQFPSQSKWNWCVFSVFFFFLPGHRTSATHDKEKTIFLFCISKYMRYRW